jgi:hypothetical protein
MQMHGAAPKAIASDRLSSSAPKAWSSAVRRNSLANQPSKVSARTATPISAPAAAALPA